MSTRLTVAELENIYNEEWRKAALIYPRLVFRQIDDYQFEMGFHFKSRNFTGIDQYKKIVRMAIQKHHPDCIVR